MLAKWTSTGSTSDTDGGYFVHNEYDCEEGTSRPLDWYWFSENMRGGVIVSSDTNIENKPKSITPESIDEGLIRIACGKK